MDANTGMLTEAKINPEVREDDSPHSLTTSMQVSRTGQTNISVVQQAGSLSTEIMQSEFSGLAVNTTLIIVSR